MTVKKLAPSSYFSVTMNIQPFHDSVNVVVSFIRDVAGGEDWVTSRQKCGTPVGGALVSGTPSQGDPLLD